MTVSYSRQNLWDAFTVQHDGASQVSAAVREGWDVFGIPHGGYLAALAAAAVLEASGQPDVFTLTVHYLRKAAVGPLRFTVNPVGGSRRFTTLNAVAHQGDAVVLSVMASVGDRTQFDGPSWRSEAPWNPEDATLTPAAGSYEQPFDTPNVAKRVGLRLDTATLGFDRGAPNGRAEIRAVLESGDHPLAALLGCDVTPPAIWGVRGVTGWVPTVELTAHVRARAAPGPLRVTATSAWLGDGFLEEDAVVHDCEGHLVVQSRQLARYAGA
jgi:hypothetical protein